MLDVYANSTTEDDTWELQNATAVFLTDQYDNSEYVATPDDIADLQDATAAFLADRGNGERFCLDKIGPGILLPGEQFLFPASQALDIARPKPDPAEDVIDLDQENLHAQMTCEDASNNSLLDAAFTIVDISKSEYTSFEDVLDPGWLPQTSQLGEQSAAPPLSEYLYVALKYLLNFPDEVDQLLGICIDARIDNNNNENGSDAATAISDGVFHAPDALYRAQASYAASFFDSVTETTVPYASFDSLLEMDNRHKQLPRVYREPDDGDAFIVADDGQMDQDTLAESDKLLVYLDDGNRFLESSSTQIVTHNLLKIVAHLPTILEEDEPYSAVSSSSMNFANRGGFLKTLTLQRKDFLDYDDEELAPLSSTYETAGGIVNNMILVTEDAHNDELLLEPQGKDGIEAFDDLFAEDIWNKEPDLEMAFSVSQTLFDELLQEAELELSRGSHCCVQNRSIAFLD